MEVWKTSILTSQTAQWPRLETFQTSHGDDGTVGSFDERFRNVGSDVDERDGTDWRGGGAAPLHGQNADDERVIRGRDLV
jgi:hypothetical protein